MSIELKVGEWYEARNGERVKVIADTGAHGIDRGDMMIAIDDTGYPCMYFSDGSEEDGRDIIKHLPDCTGWDWVEPKPEKWRDATPEDALREPHLTCRVRSTLTGEWIANCSLVGYYVSGTVPQWIVNIAGVCGTHDFCQVLDTENE